MNVQLANVISDRSGLTGQTIMRAMVAGERDPVKLAEISQPGIQASLEEVTKSLEGKWRPELLFVLQQEVEMYDVYQRRTSEYDEQLQKHLAPSATRNGTQEKENKTSQECSSIRAPERIAARHGSGPNVDRWHRRDGRPNTRSEVGLDMGR